MAPALFKFPTTFSHHGCECWAFESTRCISKCADFKLLTVKVARLAINDNLVDCFVILHFKASWYGNRTDTSIDTTTCSVHWIPLGMIRNHNCHPDWYSRVEHQSLPMGKNPRGQKYCHQVRIGKVLDSIIWNCLLNKQFAGRDGFVRRVALESRLPQSLVSQ